jgi:PucR family transcriptional regulator, purine catabolism regulatory protein
MHCLPGGGTRARVDRDGAAAVTAEDSERLGFVTLSQFLRQLPALGVLHDGGNGDERLR